MLTFKEIRDVFIKRYKINVTEANESAKSILEDMKFFKEREFKTIADVENYLINLENYGKVN